MFVPIRRIFCVLVLFFWSHLEMSTPSTMKFENDQKAREIFSKEGHFLSENQEYIMEKPFENVYTNKRRWRPKLFQIILQMLKNRRSLDKVVRQLNQNVIYCYVSREDVDEIRSDCDSLVNDPLFSQQWTLVPWRVYEQQELPYDLNVLPVWLKYWNFGEGVRVVVLDTGLEITHTDLADNYEPQYSYDAVDDLSDPTPNYSNKDNFSHGTSCAGIIGMKINNRKCGVGIAPLVTLGAIRMLGASRITEEWANDIYTRAFSFKNREIDITTNAYGPQDEERVSSSIFSEELQAIKESIKYGRDGKGVIHVFAAGNERPDGYSCASFFHCNLIYTIVASVVGVGGEPAVHVERCTAVMVSVYANMNSDDSKYKIITTNCFDSCNHFFGDTSAATSMVSGILALVLQANPNLTWRDVQHLITISTRFSNPMLKSINWQENKAGFYVSSECGFGLMDAFNLVSMAYSFESVPAMTTCVITDIIPNFVETMTACKVSPNKLYYCGGTVSKQTIYFGRHNWMRKQFTVDGCSGQPQEVNYIEHVQLEVSLIYSTLSDVQITVYSPGGTKAKVFDVQPALKNKQTLNWKVDSLMTWGESPKGTWTIDIFDTTGEDDEVNGTISDIVLIIHGTKRKPKHYNGKGAYRTEHSYRPRNFLDAMSGF